MCDFYYKTLAIEHHRLFNRLRCATARDTRVNNDVDKFDPCLLKKNKQNSDKLLVNIMIYISIFFYRSRNIDVQKASNIEMNAYSQLEPKHCPNFHID